MTAHRPVTADSADPQYAVTYFGVAAEERTPMLFNKLAFSAH